MRRTLAFLLALTALAPVVAGATRGKTNLLLRVISPVARGTVPAHPFANVIVRFSTADAGVAANPATFRARLGHTDVTDRFRNIVENGAVVGMRGAVEPPALRVGRRVLNRLRLEVHSLPRSGPGPRTLHDVDRIRFHAVDMANRPPVAGLVAPGDVFFPDISLRFDGTSSQDPDLDELTYAWDFGDGDTSTVPAPTHMFAGGSGDVTVTLRVNDGALTATDQETLVECPQPDAGRTSGLLRLDADAALEFGAVAPGASAARTVTVSNPDLTATSQVRTHLRIEGPGFTASPDTLDLAGGASTPVTLTFAPTAPGHQSADIVVVASASNRCVVHLMAHGYAGTAPGAGPTLAAVPAFYSSFGTGTAAIMPDGTRVAIDNHVHVCQSPSNGPGTGDLCIDDGDCASNGGTCNQSLTTLFDPVDMCSDGNGGLYLMSDEGTYTDPTPGDNERDVSVLRLTLDDGAARTGAAIVAHETSGTTQLACDGFTPGDGGKLYTAEFRNVNLPACFRSEQEALVALRKSTGANEVLLPRIDAAEGLDGCEDDVDQVVDLNVTGDGIEMFASLEDAGLFQIRPAFRPIVSDIHDGFQLHPDGDIVYVTATDGGTAGLLSVYKISPSQAASGAPALRDLTPCAVFKVPNNRGGPSNFGRTGLGEHSYAVGRAASDTLDATLLVSFVTTGGLSDPNPPFAPPLRIQGTVAFAMPAGSPSCSALGFVNLDIVDMLTF
jgi:PKD repeat protein